MQKKYQRFRCSHCDIEVLVIDGSDEVMVICKCGRWMGLDDKGEMDVKSHGKHAGNFALNGDKTQ